MSPWNTTVSEFVLSSLSSDPSLQLPVFLLCLLVYLVTLLGNFLMILLILVTPGLQLPMYIFLMNLSLIDILYSSAITPNAMIIMFSVRKTISIIGCATQMFLFIDGASSEAMLLAVMAYDRYVAICKPLYYGRLINKVSCFQFIFSVHTIGFINSLIHTCCAFTLPFCKSNKVNHFFCDWNPILKLSCKDIFLNQVLAYVVAGSIEVGSFICIMISYFCILRAVSRISSKSRSKFLSTCASHFTCVAVFYCPVFFMYLIPVSEHSGDQDWVDSVFYTIIIPMLNPIIYSLRNQDVKQALNKWISTNILLSSNLHSRHKCAPRSV
ncbi:olfactory receptor-like protein COR4 [Hyperolius riggenbachi]|uniref:olfactory receptor-like protein COR4 n=1 Tax=Hyperolius riggenbachi TaxID=752182 RepID=UPI0035A2F41C